jgi:adenine-specific DNA-methyltransferase
MTQPPRHGEPVARTSADRWTERLDLFKELFPECVSEGKVDFEHLRAILGDEADTRPERYSFSWAGKRDAIRLLQRPSSATLIPVPGESLTAGGEQLPDQDNQGVQALIGNSDSNHIFIEGENLEVLKLLYKPYFGRVKMIYLDPPYNTGNDFIYPDDFAEPLDIYLKLTGQKDSQGNLLTSNPETSGRYHSAWLSMIYPRLFLARQFLREDGVIFVSIDDHEVHNLRMIMNEIFGEENFIVEIVWEKTRKNDAKLFSVGHEYMIVYARSLSKLKENKTIWREAKPGAKEIIEQYRYLREQHGTDDEAIEKELKEWYKRLPEGHPSKKLSRYKHVDKWGPWRDRDISWPGGGGPRYDVPHPETKKPCKVPERGWVFSTPEEMKRQIKLGLVAFRKDHTQPPFRKAHLVPVPEELDDENQDLINGEEEDELVGLQVMPSVIYRQAQVSVKYLRNLMGEKVFDNPKDHEVLARLIRYCTSAKDKDIILDFFAGSCSTAEAVLQINREDNCNLRFIMVQLPEPTPEDSIARKEGYKNIADIGKERIRRVVARLKEAQAGKLDLSTRETPEDLGFRVFKLAPSLFRPWKPPEELDPEAWTRQMEMFSDPLTPDWQPRDLLWEVTIKEGYGLNARVEAVTAAPDAPLPNAVYRVGDPDREQSFLICLDETLHPDTIRTLDLSRDDLFICRDAALTDELAANLALQCRLKTI